MNNVTWEEAFLAFFDSLFEKEFLRLPQSLPPEAPPLPAPPPPRPVAEGPDAPHPLVPEDLP